jgi:hypothetical protein
MYVLNHFPNKKNKFVISLCPTGKFWELRDTNGGIIAEADSWRRLKKWAEVNKLSVHFNQ